MSFHPDMAYGATFHRSSRALTEPGPPFTYSPENRATFDRIVARYPPDRRRSAVLPALYLVQDRRATLVGRIALHDYFKSRQPFRCVGERLARLHQLPGRPMEGRVVLHLGMEAHRSTSPMTTSIDPITAITSAINPPTIIDSSA